MLCGECPRYRPYEWMGEERDAMKKEKAVGWYKREGYESVIFDPSTPNSFLQCRYQTEKDRRHRDESRSVSEKSSTTFGSI